MNNEKNCPICYEEYCNGTGPKDSILKMIVHIGFALIV